MSRLLVVLRRPLLKARGWHGDRDRHSEAARKGWLKRRRPPELHLASEREYRKWFLENIAGLSVTNKASGLRIRFDEGDVGHAVTEATRAGKRRFSPTRARRLPWLPVVARYGDLKLPPNEQRPRPWLVAVFELPRGGAHAVVVECDAESGTCDFVTHFPLRPRVAERIKREWPAFEWKK